MKHSARSRSELDGTIVGIELTLVSIIQGVALTVLIENAHGIVAHRNWVCLPYVLAGLLTIFVFWSRAVLHIITVIRWPLEFGHNFLYIGCGLVEAISFAELTKPERWFAVGAGFIAVGWLLFVYDLRLIRARQRDSGGEAANKLFAVVLRDQRLNIVLLLPVVFLLDAGFAFLIHTWPDLLIVGRGHLYLIAMQLLGFAGYLGYVVCFYSKLAPMIADAREEWHRGSA